MPTIKELGEKRGKLQNSAQEIIDLAEKEDRDLNPEELATFTQIHEDDKVLKNRIGNLESMDKWDKELTTVPDSSLNPPGGSGFQQPGTQDHQAVAINAWCQNKLGKPVSPEQQESCVSAGINLNSKELEFRLMNNGDLEVVRNRVIATRNNTLITSNPYEGGTVIQPTFVQNVERAMLSVGTFLSEVDEIRTDRGEKYVIPTENDTSNEGRQVGEGKTAVDANNPTSGDLSLMAYKMTTDFIKVSHEMQRDSGMDLFAYLSRIIGERLGRVTNRKCTVGNGAATVTGIMTAAKMGYTAAGAAAITADELVRLKHSVDPFYRTSAKWMFHDDVLLALKLLKDTTGRMLWQQGTAGGHPDTFDNDPYVINQTMESLGSGNKSVLYGDMKKYKLRKVRTLRIRHMTERFGEEDIDGFIGFIEIDGDLLDAGTNPVKYLEHP